MSVAVVERTRERIGPLERLELLFDPGSLHVIRSEVVSRRLGDRARPGDGVVGGAGTVAGRPVFAYAQDAALAGGSLGQAHADTIVRVLQLAGRAGAPVVGFSESAGARLQEGLAGLGGYGRVFRETVALSGRVPQISIVSGVCAGGGSYSPALTDFVVMTEDASMFLTGPGVVREVTGEDVSITELGGARLQSRNGVCQLVAEDVPDAAALARELLSHLLRSPAPVAEALGVPSVPDNPRMVYDVREVIAALVDGGRLIEVERRWARNMVTGFARLEGRPLGVVANQPRHLGGVIDATASQKAARFVRRCNSFGLPLAVLVDTPGFLPGTRQEAAGVIRHGADLLHAFAAASVPKVTVILRKAYGGAYITMNSKDLGADLAFAWPRAEIGVMGAGQAVGVLHRRELAVANDPVSERDRLAALYAGEHLSAAGAAQEGYVDELIQPADTRRRLAWSFKALEGAA